MDCSNGIIESHREGNTIAGALPLAPPEPDSDFLFSLFYKNIFMCSVRRRAVPSPEPLAFCFVFFLFVGGRLLKNVVTWCTAYCWWVWPSTSRAPSARTNGTWSCARPACRRPRSARTASIRRATCRASSRGPPRYFYQIFFHQNWSQDSTLKRQSGNPSFFFNCILFELDSTWLAGLAKVDFIFVHQGLERKNGGFWLVDGRGTRPHLKERSERSHWLASPI